MKRSCVHADKKFNLLSIYREVPMDKNLNLVACIDGTWNRYATETNVRKIFDALYDKGEYRIKGGPTVFRTRKNYERGPGTSPTTMVGGGAFATDLGRAIAKSYAWLTFSVLNNRQELDGTPSIFLFGFSRGAYSCHVLSWLLNDVGIPLKYDLAEDIAHAYVDKDVHKLSALQEESGTTIAPKVRMMGLWDTVSAPLDFKRKYHNGEKSPLVSTVYHAMSADEIRNFFPVMQYKKSKTRNIRQKWFSGVHGDVGGGYSDDCRLSDIALNWMQCHAYEEGLGFLKKPEPMKAFDFSDLIEHDESGIMDFRRRFYHKGETLHRSILARMAFDKDYEPEVQRVPERLYHVIRSFV